MRLYTVHVEFEYAVVADDEREARGVAADVAQEILDWEECAEAHVDPKYLPIGWDDKSLVYGDGDENLTFAQARARYVKEDK